MAWQSQKTESGLNAKVFFHLPSRASGSEFYLPEINFHWPQTYFLFFISGYQITTKIQVNCYILSLYYQLCDNHICLRVLFSKKNRQGTGGRVISSPLSCHASKMMLALIVTLKHLLSER